MTEWELMWWVLGIGLGSMAVAFYFGRNIPRCRCGLS